MALRSQDGSSWESLGVLVPHAGVPSACRLADGRLLIAFQWFPTDAPEAFNRVAVCFSGDDGESWSDPRSISIEGLPEGFRPPFDPCVVALEDGRLRLYFSSHDQRGTEPDSAAPGGWPATWSAVSVDGLAWSFEPGRRFGIEGQAIVDPCVVRFRGDWHYFAPLPGRDGSAFHAVSRDGLDFQRLPEIELEGAGRWLGSALTEDELGESEVLLRFFGTSRIGWSATSRDGTRWRLDGRVVWGEGADPAVVRRRDGALLMIATAPGATREEDASSLLGAITAGPLVAMTSNERHVYVLRGETIYMFDANSLRLLKVQRLPPVKLPPAGPPAPEAPAEEPSELRAPQRPGG